MSKEERLARWKSKKKVSKLYSQFIRDRWGNLTDCFWNKWMKEEILKEEKI